MPAGSPLCPSLSQQLVNSGLRATPQREVVYRALVQKRDHPTAEEVFGRVRAEMPSISLATVYNCLEALVQCHLVRSVNFERGPTRYCPNLHPHAHFHDERTGETHDIDLPAGLLEKVNAILPKGYNASSVEIVFRGKASGRENRIASETTGRGDNGTPDGTTRPRDNRTTGAELAGGPEVRGVKPVAVRSAALAVSPVVQSSRRAAPSNAGDPPSRSPVAS